MRTFNHVLITRAHLLSPDAGFIVKQTILKPLMAFYACPTVILNKNQLSTKQTLSTDTTMVKIRDHFSKESESWCFCSTYCSPPEGICIGAKICVGVFLSQVDKKRGEDEDQKTDVPGCNQLLRDKEKALFITSVNSSSIFAVINSGFITTSLSSPLAKFSS